MIEIVIPDINIPKYEKDYLNQETLESVKNYLNSFKNDVHAKIFLLRKEIII